MKQLSGLVITFVILASCNSVKNIYSDDTINERQLDKLVKIYLKTPGDTGAANRLLYAYHAILDDHLDRIAFLKNNPTLRNREQLVDAYDNLQDFYNLAAQNNKVSELVHPGNAAAERQAALYDAAAAWYDYGNQLLAGNDWKSGRDAYTVFRKVNGWIPGFEDSKALLNEAMELGTIDAVIEPLRTEGFYYNSQYSFGREEFSRQLVSDLGSAWNNSNGLYRVYASYGNYNNPVQPDWIIEPVLTRMTIDPVNYRHSTRTVTKQIEVGKDSLKNPVYKTISAVLKITEASVCAVSELEARISDVQNNTRVDRRNFSESITLSEVSATYTGDKNALSKADWDLVNNRNRLRVDERWLREKLLEKIYPDLLNYLRDRLR